MGSGEALLIAPLVWRGWPQWVGPGWVRALRSSAAGLAFARVSKSAGETPSAEMMSLRVVGVSRGGMVRIWPAVGWVASVAPWELPMSFARLKGSWPTMRWRTDLEGPT